MSQKEKRTIITLNFRDDSRRRQSEADISVDSREKLAERQKQLKEMQNKRNAEQKAQEREKLQRKILEGKKQLEEKGMAVLAEKNDVKREEEKKANNLNSNGGYGSNNNRDRNGNNRNRNDDRRGNRSDNRNNDRRENKNDNNKDENRNRTRDGENRRNVDKSDRNYDRNNYKKDEKRTSNAKDNDEERKKIIKKQQDELSNENKNKKTPFKEVKTKKRDNSDDETDSKNGKRGVYKDRDRNISDKIIQNIHTVIFNNDDDLEDNFLRKNNGFRRKRKKSEDTQLKQKIYKVVNIPELISVSDLAERMNEKKADIVKKLLMMGMKVSLNQLLDADTAEFMVIEFGHTPNRVSDADVEKRLGRGSKYEGSYIVRSPVVTVMGHIDHGKTSLLDAIRTTKFVEKEHGGITQHIGASTVEVGDDRFVTFIDTPGHEAFTEMRMRGANVTDIVVLVVAADDGIKDQTIEAINHTKAAKVPMVVAINKIDKPNADVNKVKQELLQYGVIVEDYGGEVMSVGVSAKERMNIDKLLEIILLQAEILELKAPIDCSAGGAVIESRMDAKKGVICSLLVQKGILHTGDVIVAGTGFGKVKSMINDKNVEKKELRPSEVAEVLGFSSSPVAGDIFNVVSSEKEARDIAAYRSRRILEEKEAKRASKSVDKLLLEADGGDRKKLPVILKTDVSGSAEAISNSLVKLNTLEVEVEIVHLAVGAVNESDVNLAFISNAVIIAFNVRCNSEVKNLAQQKNVEIRYYSIIYGIIDDVRIMLSGMLSPILREEIIGQAEIRTVIRIADGKRVAGCYVTEGELQRAANIRLIRDSIVIFDGKIKTLKRFKNDAKEVKFGFECGLSIENYEDVKERDIIECYRILEEKRSL
ncbi:MAG: translation initiation factor IF-2 [Rickettsiales bacterium]|jgi:translation initiation factor IF-2|nr:translation initiation factor IF-2 [Rickettsiales bacterium]